MELKGQNIPYGLHAFGRVPEKPLRDTTIDAIVSVDRSLLPDKAKVLADEMERAHRLVGPARARSICVHALSGGFVAGRQRRRADPQSRLVSDRQELLRHRSGQGAEAGVVGDGRQARATRCSPIT